MMGDGVPGVWNGEVMGDGVSCVWMVKRWVMGGAMMGDGVPGFGVVK